MSLRGLLLNMGDPRAAALLEDSPGKDDDFPIAVELPLHPSRTLWHVPRPYAMKAELDTAGGCGRKRLRSGEEPAWVQHGFPRSACTSLQVQPHPLGPIAPPQLNFLNRLLCSSGYP